MYLVIVCLIWLQHCRTNLAVSVKSSYWRIAFIVCMIFNSFLWSMISKYLTVFVFLNLRWFSPKAVLRLYSSWDPWRVGSTSNSEFHERFAKYSFWDPWRVGSTSSADSEERFVTIISLHCTHSLHTFGKKCHHRNHPEKWRL